MSGQEILAVMNACCADPNVHPANAAAMSKSRAAVAALIAERDALREQVESLQVDCVLRRQERDVLLNACQTFSEWLRREDQGAAGQPWEGKRGTPEGEAAWREWWEENLRLCALAQKQVRNAIALTTGESA